MKNALSRQRSVFVGIALVDMLIVGMAYSWSLFLAPMQADLQWSRETLTVAFTLNMSLYCLGNLLSSALNKRMDLLRQADQALYHAKSSGRNMVCMSGGGIDHKATAAQAS